jgi:uncharacterized protein YjbI with pentapeptide repeats
MAAFLLIAYVVLKLGPDWFAETKNLDAKGRADARQGVRTASLALLAGAIGVIGAVYTARTFALNRAGQLTDRFTKAIEQLGHKEQLDVRLGGIYALERIARDSKEDHPQVVEVLTAYVREHAPRRETPPRGPGTPGTPESEQEGDENAEVSPLTVPRPSTDVQGALTVLGRRELAHEDRRPRLDLSSTHLTGANLRSADLSRALLIGADLRGAVLTRAVLAEALLIETDIRGAVLSEADLREANLGGTDLRGAVLFEADLRGANLIEADLRGTALSEANLSGAQLTLANLRGAVLPEADLSGTELTEANLSEANLTDADLRDSDLYGANLHGADLSGADLRGASLHGADLSEADLKGANLHGADLSGTNLRGAKDFDPEAATAPLDAHPE